MPASIFLSDMSRGVTGEIHHVDAGYHIVGIKHPDAPDIAVGKNELMADDGKAAPTDLITSATEKPTGTSPAVCRAAMTCRSIRVAAAQASPLRRISCAICSRAMAA